MPICDMRRVVRYGKKVWENDTLDYARKTLCMCQDCANMRPGMDDHCKIASKLYEICKEHGTAFILTRCEEWVAKPLDV